MGIGIFGLIALGVLFGIIMMKRQTRSFFVIAVVEHIIFVLVLALAIYTKPASAPIERAIKVSFLTTAPEKQKVEPESLPALEPQVPRVNPTEQLPSIASTNIESYLTPAPSTSGLPSLSRTRPSIQNPDRLSLGAESPRGRSRDDLLDESPNGIVRSKPIVPQEGHFGRSERRGVPERDSQKPTQGERGDHLAGKLTPGRLSETKSDRITKGENIEIRGEVVASGREVIGGLGPLQAEGQQAGIVKLSFKVKPDGTVSEVKIMPGATVGDSRLKGKAEQYVRRIRFSQLSKNARQVEQSGEITIKFTVNVE